MMGWTFYGTKWRRLKPGSKLPLAICSIIRKKYKHLAHWLVYFGAPSLKPILSIPETKRYALSAFVPASFVARQVNQPLSCSETLFITNVPFGKTLKCESLLMESCDLNHLIKGSGSPVAEHENEAVCPLGIVWFIGNLVKTGGTEWKKQRKNT